MAPKNHEFSTKNDPNTMTTPFAMISRTACARTRRVDRRMPSRSEAEWRIPLVISLACHWSCRDLTNTGSFTIRPTRTPDLAEQPHEQSRFPTQGEYWIQLRSRPLLLPVPRRLESPQCPPSRRQFPRAPGLSASADPTTSGRFHAAILSPCPPDTALDQRGRFLGHVLS